MVDGPAGDPLAERERLVRQNLVGVLASCEHAPQLPLALVSLVEGEIVVRNQVADGVGDALEQSVQRLLREHVVEHVREAPVRLDEGLRSPGRRQRSHHPVALQRRCCSSGESRCSPVIGRCGARLEYREPDADR